MTTTQITGIGWNRGVEDRYPGTMDATLSWEGFDRAVSGDFLSGMVVGIQAGTGNQVKKANAEPFHGIMFTENSAVIDESLGGAPPTVIVGGATLFIRKTALDDAATYAPGEYLTSANGKLVPVARDASLNITTPDNAIVGFVQEQHTDGILMRLNPPTA